MSDDKGLSELETREVTENGETVVGECFEWVSAEHSGMYRKMQRAYA